MSKKISIKKLAEQLNLAPSTVHRALSGHPNVSVNTRRKVLRFSQLKGYTLPVHDKGSIAVIVPYLSFKGYLDCLLKCLETELHLHGFRLMIVSEEDISILSDHMFDGIVSLVWSDGFGKLLPQKFSIPTITLNAQANAMENIPNIKSDNRNGIWQALEYMHNRGCRKIFYISTSDISHVSDAAERLEVFRQFCSETKQDFNAMHLEIHASQIEKNIPLILNSGADACFCAIETFAVKLGHLIKAAGKRIPEDISLMGLEDNYANAYFTPPITAIRQNFEQIAQMAASQIASACLNQIPPRGGIVPFQLIERQSVREPSVSNLES